MRLLGCWGEQREHGERELATESHPERSGQAPTHGRKDKRDGFTAEAQRAQRNSHGITLKHTEEKDKGNSLTAEGAERCKNREEATESHGRKVGS
jgi:hypothetical protein